MTSRDPKGQVFFPKYVWSQISRKRLGVESRLQYSTYRKYGVSIWSRAWWRHVAQNVMVVTQICLKHISRRLSETKARFRWTTSRKSHMENRIVTWLMTSRDLKRSRSRSWPQYVCAFHLESGWRCRHGCNRPPIGNGTRSIKWSRDRWPQVTLNSQGRDPQYISAQ